MLALTFGDGWLYPGRTEISNRSKLPGTIRRNAMRLRYRPDIDGLRAVAVLAVIVFHTFPKVLPGGFVGVDIFFVISGYLITQIILEGMDSGSFTASSFYARRVRRIFPALIVVLIATF